MKDEPGVRYGDLVLMEKLPERWRGNVVGLWKCDCGEEKRLPMARVRAGQAKSCGCKRTKHGECKRGVNSPEYVAWIAMRARCSAKQGRDHEAYSARGISICERWASFDNFLNDMGRKPSPQHSLGRIDNNLGYSPRNCQWETPIQQQRNTRRSNRWHIKGRDFESVRAAAACFGVDHKTVRYWVKTSKDGCYAIPRY